MVRRWAGDDRHRAEFVELAKIAIESGNDYRISKGPAYFAALTEIGLPPQIPVHLLAPRRYCRRWRQHRFGDSPGLQGLTAAEDLSFFKG